MALRRTLFSTSQLRAAASAPCPCGMARRLSAEEPPLLLRLLQRRPLFHSAVPPDRRSDRLIDRIRATVADRIRLDGILPPAAAPAGMTAEEVRKVIRATQMEAARARLRDVGKSCVAYEEFVQMCCDASSEKQGPGIARTLDQAGAVIVLGDHVLLRPDQITNISGTSSAAGNVCQIPATLQVPLGLRVISQRHLKCCWELPHQRDLKIFSNRVAKAVRSMIPLPTIISPQSDERSNELLEMKEKKAVIDKKANALVRKELWGGLCFLALQTVGFMRLTFWELSWDVMEPICFFVTSTYFMAGYAFFMRTAKDPSFEGFFEVRFAAKQKLLMKEHNFDRLRFDELRRACSTEPSEEPSSPHYYCQCNR